MGLIAARPEEPENWAGIPSEPRDAEVDAQQWADAPLAATDAFGLLGGGAIESIAIPVPAIVEVQDADATPGDGPRR